MMKFRRILSTFSLLALGACVLPSCADEDETEAVLNASDRGVLGLKIRFPRDHGSDTLSFEITRLDEIVADGDGLIEGEEILVGLKLPGLVVARDYSISIISNSSSSDRVCRGLVQGWEIKPGMVTTVDVPMTCGLE